MIFAYMQNLGATHTVSKEFSGVARAHQQLNMICVIAHKQPQPKRIGVTRIMSKKPQKNINNFGPQILPCVP